MYLGKEVITDMTKDPQYETGDEKLYLFYYSRLKGDLKFYLR